MTNIHLIDTNIWYYAYVLPKNKDQKTLHQKANSFLQEQLEDPQVQIGLSTYQLAEILETLRRAQVPKAARFDLLQSFKTEKFLVIPLTAEQAGLAVRKSARSNVHVYDYLVALPLQGTVHEIFSADNHFQHPDFLEIAPVTNPLST